MYGSHLPITDAVYGKGRRSKKKAASGKKRSAPVTTVGANLSSNTRDALLALKDSLS